mmetsp:Transcript_33250/g.46408  ORF Transcript_33250/g.46408 Transcript_33250/m.46408 type:complete len:85 (+) Transcript_33250:410-664(+)
MKRESSDIFADADDDYCGVVLVVGGDGDEVFDCSYHPGAVQREKVEGDYAFGERLDMGCSCCSRDILTLACLVRNGVSKNRGTL